MGNTIQESIVMGNYFHGVIKGSLYSKVYGIWSSTYKIACSYLAQIEKYTV